MPDQNIKTTEDMDAVTRELSRFSKMGGDSSLDDQNLNRNAVYQQHLDMRESRKATLDTILKRNNSITTVKKHAIPFSSLHKKTYFNALEMILNSPRNIKKQEDSKRIHDATSKVFEDMFKHPPSRLENDFVQTKMGKSKAKNNGSPIRFASKTINSAAAAEE